MPIYEYVCEQCKNQFEKLVLSRSEKIACPSCGSRHHTLQPSVIAAPAKSGGGSSTSSGCACTPSTCGCH
jgi:putative FmdB family regulatory protein